MRPIFGRLREEGLRKIGAPFFGEVSDRKMPKNRKPKIMTFWMYPDINGPE
jgi:hypothetical protein